MDSNKTLIITLSLSVLTLAIVSTFLTLNQSGVLGTTTTAPVRKPSGIERPPTVAPPSQTDRLCKELSGIYNRGCLKNTSDLNTDSSDVRPTGKTAATYKPIINNEPVAFCDDLLGLMANFCPNATIGPRPTEIVKPPKTTLLPSRKPSGIVELHPSRVPSIRLLPTARTTGSPNYHQ
jgi:hypothetical protein